MRLDHPRVPLTDESDWDDDSRPLLEAVRRNNGGRVLNVFRTIAQHPKLLKRWTVFANHVLGGSSLPARERELVILRTGYLCGSGYEWAQHVAIARRCGVTDDEVRRLVEGSTDPNWSADDRALLEATDELVGDKFISDLTWAELAQRWDRKQLMDLVFTVGQYTLVSMALNTFGVQLEDDTETFPPEMFDRNRFPTGPGPV